MNLTLGFPNDPQIERHTLARRGGVEAAITRFEQRMSDPDSPVRAIRRQPARSGEYVEIPDSVHPTLRRALVERGIARLYTHQAEVFDLCAAGNNVVGSARKLRGHKSIVTSSAACGWISIPAGVSRWFWDTPS